MKANRGIMHFGKSRNLAKKKQAFDGRFSGRFYENAPHWSLLILLQGVQRYIRDFKNPIRHFRVKYHYIAFKYPDFRPCCQLVSVAGTVIQASGRLVLEDGLRSRLPVAHRFMLNRRPH